MRTVNLWWFIMGQKRISMYSARLKGDPTWIFKVCSFLRGMMMQEAMVLMSVPLFEYLKGFENSVDWINKRYVYIYK